MADTPTPTWLSVASAAAASGVPERSLFRWARAGVIPTRTENGILQIEHAAVQARAASRAAASAQAAAARAVAAARPVPTAAASGGGGGGGCDSGGGTATPMASSRPPQLELDGEMASRGFALFENGASAPEVIIDERLPPHLVFALWADYQRADGLAGDRGQSPVADRLSTLEKQLGRILPWFEASGASVTLVDRVGYCEDGILSSNTICDKVEILESALASLASRVARLPVPTDSWGCPSCGSIGLVEVPVRCTRCGHDGHYGIYKPARK